MMFKLRANPIVLDYYLKPEGLMLALVQFQIVRVSDRNEYSCGDWLFNHAGQGLFKSQGKNM